MKQDTKKYAGLGLLRHINFVAEELSLNGNNETNKNMIVGFLSYTTLQ
jgi:hypothetical protein